MNRFLRACTAALTLLCAHAHAGTDADAMLVKLRNAYPNTTFSSVRAAPISGLWEVVMGKNVAYTDDEARYVIFGSIFDFRAPAGSNDLTAARQREVATSYQAKRRVPFPTAFENDAIKVVRGTGRRRLAVFADPNCGYCKSLEAELLKLNDVTILTFPYPILSGDSKSKAMAVWCAADRGKAWTDWMLTAKAPQLASCSTPIDRILVMGSGLGISGTPTLVSGDGRVREGAASASTLSDWLDAGDKVQ